MVKTERTIDDDGVDLSYDSATSAVKKEITHPGSSHPLDVIHRLKSEGLNMGAGSAHSTNTTSSHFYSQPQHSPQSAAAAGSHSMPQQPASPASSRGSVGTNAGGGGGTSSTPGGRLKFFREGRMLLELTHRGVGEGERTHWVPSGNKKVYWPPGPAPLTSRLDSNASTNTVTGSDGSLETGSSHNSLTLGHPASPWGGSPSPRLPLTWQPTPTPADKPRIKPIPTKITKQPSSDIVFAMKPPQGVKNYRKKIRPFRRRCRQPGTDIKIGTFVLKLEIQSAAGKVKLKRKSPPHKTIEQRALRLDEQIAKIVTRKSQIQVPISAWRVGRTDLAGLIKNPPSEPGSPVGKMAPASPAAPSMHYPAARRPVSPPRIYPSSPVPKYHGVTQLPGGGMKVKSELKMVTETCTSTITSVSTSQPRQNKVKAETRTVSAETRPVPVRTMPITPTIGRVKTEGGGMGHSPAVGHPGLDGVNNSPGRGLKMAALTSLMTPEMARVRMEIGPTPHHQDREPSFASPRKRFLKDYPDGQSPAKHRRLSTEHRLSTDSLGSTGDRASPYLPHRGNSPLPHSAASRTAAGGSNSQDVKPFTAFSIDNLISGSQAAAAARLAASSAAQSSSSPSRNRRDSNQYLGSPHPGLGQRSTTPSNPVGGLSLRHDLTPSSHHHSVPDSPGKVHAPTPTRPRGTSRDSLPPARPASSPPHGVSSSHHSAAASHQNAAAALMNPFLYPGGGPGAAGQHPLLAAAASQQIAYLAAIQNQANLLTQQLREQGVNPAMLQHALQQQQIQQQQAALAAAAAGGHSLFPGMPPSAASQFPGANPFAMHPAFNPYLAAVSAAGGFAGLPGAASMPPAVSIASASIPSIPTSVWTPPVGGVATPTPPNSNSSGQRETPTPTRTSHSGLSSPGYPTSTSQSLATSMGGGGHHPSLLRIKESMSPPPTSGAGSMDIKREGSQRQSSEAPLNLSMRPTTL